MQTVIGLDIGHSMVKAVALSEEGRHTITFPSVVTHALPISDDMTAREAEKETVSVQGRNYFVGNTAAEQGAASSVTGLNHDWINSAEYMALFLVSLKKLKDKGVPGVNEAMIVVGLPATQVKTQGPVLKELLTGKGGKEIIVQSQPSGPYYGIMFNQDGSVAKDRNMKLESWGVVDVGHFTTDFILMMKGNWIERASDSTSGVSVATDHLQRLVRDRKQITIDLLEAQEALVTNSIRNFGKLENVEQEVTIAANSLTQEIVDRAEALIAPYARKLDGVILAGGGTTLIYRDLKTRWPHTLMAGDPRMAIADGFSRYGRALSRARQATKQAA